MFLLSPFFSLCCLGEYENIYETLSIQYTVCADSMPEVSVFHAEKKAFLKTFSVKNPTIL